MKKEEIKFELAKVALITCRHMTSESLTESLKNLYDWITDEPAQNSSWGEDDEKVANNLISQIGNLYTRKLIKEETKDKYVNWLKSVIDRVGCEANCTTAIEWSDDDERKYIQAIEALEDFGKFELADWLKELALKGK